MIEHHFGGPWTELKPDAVCYYVECYTKALSRKQFDLWYVEAFAGAGERTNERLFGGLDQQPIEMSHRNPAGVSEACNECPVSV
jgi:hypothetical protein